MKKHLSTLLLTIVSIAIIATLSSWSYAPKNLNLQQLSTAEVGGDWILIGEVTLSNYNNSSETIKANLYVREVANNLIYRVEYQGTYYATRWHDYSNTYHVTINEKTYRCDVPALSNGNTSNNQSQNKFVGVWKSTEKGIRDFGDIQISNKDGKLYVQIKKTYGLQSKFVTCNNNEIEWSIDVSVDYGKWQVATYEPYVGQVIVGGGYKYSDRRKPIGGVSREYTLANKEVLRECYKARIKDGNLNISISYKYLYYNNSTFCFSCNGDNTIDDVIYTKW